MPRAGGMDEGRRGFDGGGGVQAAFGRRRGEAVRARLFREGGGAFAQNFIKTTKKPPKMPTKTDRKVLYYGDRGAESAPRTEIFEKKGETSMEILQTLLVGAAAIVLIALVLKLLKVSIKGILGFIVNAAVGIALIFLLNMIPGVAIPLTWWTGLVSGLFGIPGVVVLLIIFLIL